MKIINKKNILIYISLYILLGLSLSSSIGGSHDIDYVICIDVISKQTARHIAQIKLYEFQKCTYRIEDSIDILDDDNNILCYGFNLKPQGFIIISAHQLLPPILAYSFTSSLLEDQDTTMQFLHLFTTDLSQRLKYHTYYSQNYLQQQKESLHLHF